MRLLIAGLLVAVAVGAYVAWEPRQGDSSIGIREAGLLLKAGEYRSALAAAEYLLAADARDAPALLIAGEAATKLGDTHAAIRFYERVADQDAAEFVSARFAIAELTFHAGHLSEAETRLREVLERDREFVAARYRLASLLNLTGRRWEAREHQLALLRAGHGSVRELALLADPERVIEEQAFMSHCRAAAPHDPLLQLALAAIATAQGQVEDAEPLLEAVVAANPALVEAHVRLGAILAARGAAGTLIRWKANLPADAADHPGTWAAIGGWLERQERFREAARCYWEALARDANSRESALRLAQILQGLDRDAEAAALLQRCQELATLSRLGGELYRNAADLPAMSRAADCAVRLGRWWEAWAWSQEALRLNPALEWARTNVVSLQPKLTGDAAGTVSSAEPARLVDTAGLPLPDWSEIATNTGSPRDAAETVPIHFRDIAPQAGIDFAYDNGGDRAPGARIIETTGGGVAVGDYDVDGYPDLYFTQGGTWPAAAEAADSGCGPARDRCYRNRGDGTARDVTASAGLGCCGFGQGAAFGDFDSDGFPDLYVANLGANVLYRNNGDGTFQPWSEPIFEVQAWTTSCFIADLNRDGHPDIYDVRYCADANAFHKICAKANVPRACSPQSFQAAHDRLLINQGDGRFIDHSTAAGVDLPECYGLGAVAFDSNGNGGMEVFVANDQVENAWLVPTRENGEALAYANDAYLAGLAVDQFGRAQGCMGVACGDFDGNGKLDLFVTNFLAEANTLYLQVQDGLFADHSTQSGLYESSLRLLGFGTQSLDADLDGWLDLVIANGHIDDPGEANEPYHMRPQFYRNTGGGRFVEYRGAEAGEFFDVPRLGRGLARLDWNRDGREDFAVSHIGAGAALVINETLGGAFITLQLVGVESSRDARGAVVEAIAGERQLLCSLTAGDGYQACNEPRVTLGLGDSERADALTIRWPSGRVQKVGMLPARAHYVVVEGRRPVAVSVPPNAL